MGNRATVVFVAGDSISPAVYLHWNGGPESVYAFLDELDRRQVRADADYECARFIGIVSEFFDSEAYGGHSLGVVNGPEAITPEALALVRTDHGDNGFYVVNRADRSGITRYPQGLDVALANGDVKPPAPRRTVRRFQEDGAHDWELAEWSADKAAVEAEWVRAHPEEGMPGYAAIRAYFVGTGKPLEADRYASTG